MGLIEAWFLVALNITFNVYSQLILKYRITRSSPMGSGTRAKIWYLGRLILHPLTLSSFVAAFFGSLCWMGAMTRLPLSLAYPFTGLALVLIALCGVVMFGERVKLSQAIGMAMVIGGLTIVACA